MKIRAFVGSWLVLFTLSSAALAQGKTELTWFGHSAFKIKTPKGKVILIDPWITNPANKTGKEDLAKLTQADLILVSHGHSDHVGDSVEIAKRTGAKLVSTFDLGRALVQYAGFPKAQAGMETQGNFGGEITLLDGELKVALIPAVHSSSVIYAHGDTEEPEAGGNPGGFLITLQGGPSIYHTGDTDLFSDMVLIPRFHKVDVMLACIGGHFTMGPDRAAEAVRLVRPDKVVPMHFGTFPAIKRSPEEFGGELQKKKAKAKLEVVPIGGTITL